MIVLMNCDLRADDDLPQRPAWVGRSHKAADRASYRPSAVKSPAASGTGKLPDVIDRRVVLVAQAGDGADLLHIHPAIRRQHVIADVHANHPANHHGVRGIGVVARQIKNLMHLAFQVNRTLGHTRRRDQPARLCCQAGGVQFALAGGKRAGGLADGVTQVMGCHGSPRTRRSPGSWRACPCTARRRRGGR